MFESLLRYWNTLRYLKFSQISSRVWRKIKRVRVDLSPAGELRVQGGEWLEPARCTQRMFGEQSFRFLNQSHDLVSADDWNNAQWEKLWLYNLHYFDDLMAVDAGQRVGWHRSLIQRWIDENPVGQGYGWEPYPSSLRIVNWIKWALAGNVLEDHWLHSLAIQVRSLSQNLEFHLLGNHLFANAKALYFAGLIFDGDEAERWYEMGCKLIEQELPEQVLVDGGNFELSPMYHAIFLDDLLDLFNIHHAFDRNLPNGLKERIPLMMNWLDAMCHPDGEISFFNDASLGVVPISGVRTLFFALFGEESTRHKLKNESHRLLDLSDSGYSRVDIGNAVALIDRAAVGSDYLPGHAHADTLCFELSLFRQRVVVNSGTSVYETGEQRQIERGTAAHSTVVVNGENSSEVWGGFRVARRARVFDREQSDLDGVVRLSACHDGYKRFSGDITHCREWLFENNLLTIMDRLSGKGVHDIMSVLPLHPEVGVGDVLNNRVVLDVIGHEVVVTVDGVGLLEVVKSFYHPEFGVSVENRKIVFRSKGKLPIEITTRICW